MSPYPRCWCDGWASWEKVCGGCAGWGEYTLKEVEGFCSERSDMSKVRKWLILVSLGWGRSSAPGQKSVKQEQKLEPAAWLSCLQTLALHLHCPRDEKHVLRGSPSTWLPKMVCQAAAIRAV